VVAGLCRSLSASAAVFQHFSAMFSIFQQLFDAAVGEVIHYPGPAPKPFSISDAAGAIQ